MDQEQGREQGGSTLTDSAGPALSGLAGLLARAAGQGAQWADRITADTLLEADLGIDSVEWAELNVLVRAKYGDGIDLVAFLGSLDLDQIIGLTVGGLVGHLREAVDGEEIGGGGGGGGESGGGSFTAFVAASASASGPTPTSTPAPTSQSQERS